MEPFDTETRHLLAMERADALRRTMLASRRRGRSLRELTVALVVRTGARLREQRRSLEPSSDSRGGIG